MKDTVRSTRQDSKERGTFTPKVNGDTSKHRATTRQTCDNNTVKSALKRCICHLLLIESHFLHTFSYQMTSLVRILSVQTIDSSPAVLLVSPNGRKTLVNCAEGCQRIFLEFGQKIGSVDRVCLTHLAPDATGGLPGMILTAADVGMSQQAAAQAATPSIYLNNWNDPLTTNGRKLLLVSP